MSNVSRYMVFGSMGVAALVAVASLVDLIVGIPFARNFVLDICFLLGAGLVFYMAWDAYQDLA